MIKQLEQIPIDYESLDEKNKLIIYKKAIQIKHRLSITDTVVEEFMLSVDKARLM